MLGYSIKSIFFNKICYQSKSSLVVLVDMECLLQSQQRRGKHWGWVLHIDGVLWFPRKSLPWQWSALPWGASLHNLLHWSCFYTTVFLFIHSAVMGHKSIKITYHCWDSCISSQNRTSNKYSLNCVQMRATQNDCRAQNCRGSVVLQTSSGMWKYRLRKYTIPPCIKVITHPSLTLLLQPH